MSDSAILAAPAIDWGILLKLVVSSLAGGLGLTAVFAIAVYAAIRSIDLRRDGRLVFAGAFVLVSALALCVVAAGVVYGISILTTKT